MTKEDLEKDLEKEATEYALEWGDKTDGTYACSRDGYLAGAEPREKRIEKLEKENAELKAQIEKMKCCGNCQKLRVRFDSKTNINILYCSDSDMKQIEVGFQMCCCKWGVKENG